MLDTYDFKNDLWLCHSFSGKCFDFTAYVPASKVLGEIKAFLDGNTGEVITVFVEDYAAPGSLGKALAAAGLTKYVFPVSAMPKNGGDWPLLKDMVAQNHRLLVFTSKQGKEGSDGVAHEWSYVVETQCNNIIADHQTIDPEIPTAFLSWMLHLLMMQMGAKGLWLGRARRGGNPRPWTPRGNLWCS